MSSGYLFGASSVYSRLLDSAPIAGNSAASVSQIVAASQARAVGVNFNAGNMPLYVATASTPHKKVAFNNCFQNSVGVPPAFAAAMNSVPIPSGALPSNDSDAHLAVYNPATDQLWELFHTKVSGGYYSACWGGRIDDVSNASGQFPRTTGATASGLSMIGTQITVAEFRSGAINHAIGLSLPATKAGVFSYPATRTDGRSSDPNTPMQGQRFRLDPSINVDALDMTPLGKMVARAAQRYGFVVINTSGAVSIHMESPTPSLVAGGGDPWPAALATRPRGNIAGADWNQMAGFPWHRLQAVSPNWR